MATVVLAGTLDTKGVEYEYLRSLLRDRHGVDVLLVDVGILGFAETKADVSRAEVARAAGADIAALAAAGDRGAAIATMADGLATVVRDLHARGRLDGILSVGGSGNSSLVSAAMRALPIGVPKLIVSTMASGDTRPYVGAVDIAMMYSVVDIAGINAVSSRILSNAAAAIAGMATAVLPVSHEHRPLVGASMFGVTTPCVTEARHLLEERGYEVLVFHATGTGGQSMEALATGGFLAGVLDITTTELADDLVGGVLSAGPERLEAAGAKGLPQVVSVGALDMVNFGPADTVPPKFAARSFVKHNPTVTLMRTTAEENAELGRRIARKLNAASGPVALYLPLRGVSAIDVPGQPFHDPGADDALFAALREGLGANVELHEIDTDINDPAFARAMAERLDDMIRSTAALDGAKPAGR
ncbi:MAG: Tm-1-like ATP-binding domain-containing protein [Vulcanimicrobiaceae bacterium]